MNEKEIREAVENLKTYRKCHCTMGYIGKMFDTFLDLATRYLELGGVVEERANSCKNGLCEELWADCYNEGRQDTLLAMMKRLEGLENYLKNGKYEAVKDIQCIDECYLERLATALRNHILNTKGE